MIVIGLTGSLATGKTTVARMFSRLGAKVFDADKIAHAVTRPGQAGFQKIAGKFGADVLRQGRINRKRLAQAVFQDIRQLKILEKIIHPLVIKEINQELARLAEKKKRSVVVLDVPLLFESGLSRITNFTITVWVPQKIQLQRILKAKRLSRQQALARIRAQMPLRRKAQLSDYIIDNRGSWDSTRRQVRAIWDGCMSQYKNKKSSRNRGKRS